MSAVVVVWLFKLQVHGHESALVAARVGPVPGVVVLVAAGVLLATLFVAAWLATDDLVD